jgi:tRNA 2-thiocytidine biosynthesis protein TtcA
MCIRDRGRVENVFNAMNHVVPSHLMDRNLFPFQTLQATGLADAAGDRAFDEDDSCGAPQGIVLRRQD